MSSASVAPEPSRGLLQVLASREKEVAQLAVKKYLDALCVCAWALTSCLMAASTFALAAWVRQPLTPATVLVSLSLFNVLLAPLNALPWVLGGLVEAHVSASRLAAFVSQRDVAAEHSAAAAVDGDSYVDHGSVASTPRVRGALPSPVGSVRSPVAGITAGVYSFGWDAVLQASYTDRAGKDSSGALSRKSGGGAPLAVQLMGASFARQAAAHDAHTDAATQPPFALRDISFSIPKVRVLVSHAQPMG